jgi:hypothetical protein
MGEKLRKVIFQRCGAAILADPVHFDRIQMNSDLGGLKRLKMKGEIHTKDR